MIDEPSYRFPRSGISQIDACANTRCTGPFYMQFEQDGLTLWFGTSDAPAPKATVPADTPNFVTIGVRPQDAHHRVIVLYRVNGSEARTLVADWIRSDFDGKS